jgi:hypothetical protein
LCPPAFGVALVLAADVIVTTSVAVLVAAGMLSVELDEDATVELPVELGRRLLTHFT